MASRQLQDVLNAYAQVERDYVDVLRAKGLAFAERGADDAECARLRDELALRGAQFRNAGASILVGAWLSPACVECTGTGGSETFSTTFKCHRDCYFCFNYNLADYDTFVRDGCPWEEGLARCAEANADGIGAIGLTGGEPLLRFDDSIRFLERARELFPEAHKRMYTSGDLLTEEKAAALAQAGLREIRFSIKQDDPDDTRERVLSNMKMATRFIDDVVVEMPIIPGTKESMQGWMLRFAENGIHGMNLLEFCFPFHSWDEFEKRGFTLRNPPFPVMYDYGYSGGLAVSGSEKLSLELMLWGLGQGLPYGMHYCSLENKHRSELRQVNERARKAHPCFEFDEDDFFLKTARVYGDDCARAEALLRDTGCMFMVPDTEEGSLTFPPSFGQLLVSAGLEVMSVFALIAHDERGNYIHEAAVKPFGAKSI